jgi:hypothetical protein
MLRVEITGIFKGVVGKGIGRKGWVALMISRRHTCNNDPVYNTGKIHSHHGHDICMFFSRL